MTFYINKKRSKILYMALSMQICLFQISIRGGRLPSIQSQLQTFLNSVLGKGRGGQNFSKISEIQKVLNYPRGGGSSLIGNFKQRFLCCTVQILVCNTVPSFVCITVQIIICNTAQRIVFNTVQRMICNTVQMIIYNILQRIVWKTVF